MNDPLFTFEGNNTIASIRECDRLFTWQTISVWCAGKTFQGRGNGLQSAARSSVRVSTGALPERVYPSERGLAYIKNVECAVRRNIYTLGRYLHWVRSTVLSSAATRTNRSGTMYVENATTHGGAADVLSLGMSTSKIMNTPTGIAATMWRSIAWSWKNTLAAYLQKTKRFITKIRTSSTIESRTWRLSFVKPISV